MTQLSELPPEIIIFILDKLEINDLITFFKTNKYLFNYSFNYQTQLSSAYSDYLYPQSACDKVLANIETLTHTIHVSQYGFGIFPCLLSQTLSKAMNLTTFHNMNGRAIYDELAAFSWWECYIDLLPGMDDDRYHYHIYPDDFIKTTFKEDLMRANVDNIDLIPIATLRNIIESHIKKRHELNFTIPLTPQIISDIVSEKEEIEIYSEFYAKSRIVMKKRSVVSF